MHLKGIVRARTKKKAFVGFDRISEPSKIIFRCPDFEVPYKKSAASQDSKGITNDDESD